MSDSVLLFPPILQPAVTLKAYAPMGVRFWENQESALDGMKEFADGWFARRHKSAQAALEAARRMSDAATPADILREFQDWLKGVMETLAEDGMAYQRHALGAGTHPAAQAATPEPRQHDQQRSG